MSDQPEKPPHVSQSDWDAADLPEWTDRDFKLAMPFSDTHPEAFAEWKRGSGRTRTAEPKKVTNFRLDSAVIEGIKATGRGYNARVERVLREALAEGKLDAPRDVPGRPEPKR